MHRKTTMAIAALAALGSIAAAPEIPEIPRIILPDVPDPEDVRIPDDPTQLDPFPAGACVYLRDVDPDNEYCVIVGHPWDDAGLDDDGDGHPDIDLP